GRQRAEGGRRKARGLGVDSSVGVPRRGGTAPLATGMGAPLAVPRGAFWGASGRQGYLMQLYGLEGVARSALGSFGAMAPRRGARSILSSGHSKVPGAFPDRRRWRRTCAPLRGRGLWRVRVGGSGRGF